MVRLSKFSKLVLLENAGTFSERNKVLALENETAVSVDSVLISKLYKAVLSKADLDFDTIPDSKGDITKFEGYSSTKDVLSLLEALAKDSRVNIPDINTVNKALHTLELLRTPFVKGFMMNNSIVTLLYNSVILSILDSTSHIMSSYVDFVRSPNSVEFKIIKTKTSKYRTSISNLESFNEIYKSGDLNKLLADSLRQRDNFTGTSFLVVASSVAALSLVVPLLREMVYYFYFARVTVSDYLNHQTQLLEINKANLENSKLTPKEKKEVAKTQTKYVNKLHELSEKIAVPAGQSEKEVKHSIMKDDQAWTIDTLKSEVANTDSSGFSLL